MHSTAHDVEVREGAGHYLSPGWEGGGGGGGGELKDFDGVTTKFTLPLSRREAIRLCNILMTLPTLAVNFL